MAGLPPPVSEKRKRRARFVIDIVRVQRCGQPRLNRSIVLTVDAWEFLAHTHRNVLQIVGLAVLIFAGNDSSVAIAGWVTTIRDVYARRRAALLNAFASSHSTCRHEARLRTIGDDQTSRIRFFEGCRTARILGPRTRPAHGRTAKLRNRSRGRLTSTPVFISGTSVWTDLERVHSGARLSSSVRIRRDRFASKANSGIKEGAIVLIADLGWDHGENSRVKIIIQTCQGGAVFP